MQKYFSGLGANISRFSIQRHKISSCCSHSLLIDHTTKYFKDIKYLKKR